MSFLDQITVLILTYNEAPNIERTLRKLSWAKEIVIVDSGSTDETLEIAGAHPQVRVIFRIFDGFAEQCNFGLEQISGEWVLSIDADYELTDEIIEELSRLKAGDDVSGYRAGFVYRVYGKPLRSSLYPPRTVLYRRNRASYRNEGHGHRVSVCGKVESLRGRIFHDDRKSLSRWFSAQQRYAIKEADYLLGQGQVRWTWADTLRRLGWPAPMLVFLYTLFIKRCVFDGWAGWFYVLQRTLTEGMIAAEIIDRRLRPPIQDA